MDKIELKNQGHSIATVGELKEVLEPFVDDCEINSIRVYYCPMTTDIRGAAKLEIALSLGG